MNRESGLKVLEAMEMLTGEKMELTIRGERDFTLSFEGNNLEAVQAVKEYFGASLVDFEADYDDECDHTAIWFSV